MWTNAKDIYDPMHAYLINTTTYVLIVQFLEELSINVGSTLTLVLVSLRYRPTN